MHRLLLIRWGGRDRRDYPADTGVGGEILPGNRGRVRLVENGSQGDWTGVVSPVTSCHFGRSSVLKVTATGGRAGLIVVGMSTGTMSCVVPGQVVCHPRLPGPAHSHVKGGRPEAGSFCILSRYIGF